MATLNARGNTMGTNRPIVPEGGITNHENKVVRLFTVRTGCGRYRRSFEQFCQLHGIVKFIAHDVCDEGKHGYQTVYEVCGAKATLDELSTLACIASWTHEIKVGARHLQSSVFPKQRNAKSMLGQGQTKKDGSHSQNRHK